MSHVVANATIKKRHTHKLTLTYFVRMCEFWFCASLNIINFMWAFHRDCVDLCFIFNFIIGWLAGCTSLTLILILTHAIPYIRSESFEIFNKSRIPADSWQNACTSAHWNSYSMVMREIEKKIPNLAIQKAPSATHIFYSLAIHSPFVFFASFLLLYRSLRTLFFPDIIREN